MGVHLPVIGITADFEPQKNGNHPRHFLKAPYVDSIQEAGALVVILPFPFEPKNKIEQMSQWDFLDGILLSGSGPDIPPSFYGKEEEIEDNPWMVRERVLFEQILIRKSEEDKTPLLGICGGLQALNVLRGGTLIQDIPSHHQDFLDHQAPHFIQVETREPLLKWLPVGGHRVNSFHHQGIEDLGVGLCVFARSPDGIVEGIIDPDHPFLLAVQWHPERTFDGDELSPMIIKEFVEACARRKLSKTGE